MNKDLMFSSRSMEWATPQDLYDVLDGEFHFTLDPCSTDENAKCKLHYTLIDNGLEQDWRGQNVFCNPPYGKQIGAWVEKCYRESLKPKTLVVMLIPARTDTMWFHRFIYYRAEIRFVRGRLKFGGSVNPAPFPSMIVIFRPTD